MDLIEFSTIAVSEGERAKKREQGFGYGKKLCIGKRWYTEGQMQGEKSLLLDIQRENPHSLLCVVSFYEAGKKEDETPRTLRPPHRLLLAALRPPPSPVYGNRAL